MMQSKILIADDHPLFRSAMRQALSSVVGNNLVEAANFDDAVTALQQDEDIDLVFLDLKMPGNSGLTGLTEIRTQFPNVLVVIVSAEEQPNLILRAIKLGASGYIPKSSSLPDIVGAVERVLDGEQWLPDGIDANAIEQSDDVTSGFARRMAQLTPHQFKVLRMMADGLLNKQIAYELNISESTVKQHASAVLRKLDVINRTQAGVLFKQLMDTE